MVILDLCGGTGAWSQPYRSAGYCVELVDLPRDVRLLERLKVRIHGILAAPPCTVQSYARNRYPPTDDELRASLSIVDACLRVVFAHRDTLKWWALFEFFLAKMLDAMAAHDTDKLTDIDGFHADFLTGFKVTEWWDRHRKLNRHHLQQEDGVPADVNLIDVLDFIADCVMAGMARSGGVYALKLPPELLERAFQNTVELLKQQVTVRESRAVAPPGGAGSRQP